MVVLPFRLLQDDDEIGALRDGIPEALTVLLATRPSLKMVSNRVAQERGESPDLVALGRTLKVDRLLTGSILRGGDDVRATVQLVDAADGSVLWSQTIQHDFENVIALQDHICSEIAEQLPLSDETAVPQA
jgi:TolB-like protein